MLEFFRRLPSDLFSFVGGAVFSAAINIATSRLRQDYPAPWLLVVLGCMALSTCAFLRIGFVLKGVKESISGKADEVREIRNILPRLLCWSAVAVVLLFLGLVLVLVI